MYKTLFTLDGTYNNVKDLNEAIRTQTGDPEPFFDEDSEEWRAWIEEQDGKTNVLYDGA